MLLLHMLCRAHMLLVIIPVKRSIVNVMLAVYALNY